MTAETFGIKVPCHKGSWMGGLGQLSFKEEAAGKLRVFAIVDS
jgi:hypothetical protein